MSTAKPINSVKDLPTAEQREVDRRTTEYLVTRVYSDRQAAQNAAFTMVRHEYLRRAERKEQAEREPRMW
jgi:hypothetical protein